jgi:lipid-binding SYLF domain-containing protein
MKRSSVLVPLICCGFFILNCATAAGQFKEDRIIQESMAVISEIMAIPASGIPQSMLSDAQAVAIIPGVIKGSFVVGARYGNGVVLVRDEQSGWHAPVFITLTGGNIGWQVGVQSTDVVLVFKTRKSVDGLLSGRLTMGADAAVAAGPVGRQAAAATDTNLGAQIYSYSRSRGLFAGVSFDGSVIRVDPISNATYYHAATPGGPVLIPPGAQQLAWKVIQYTGNQTPATSPTPAIQTSAQTSQPILAQQHSIQEVDHLRDQLAKLAPEMYELLDPPWQQFLGLPAQIFQGNGNPSLEDLELCLANFDTIKNDPQYMALANQPEFQSTYGLLRHYIQAISNDQNPLNLPAPPTR